MALRLGELVAIISADDSKFHKSLKSVHAGLQKVGKLGALAALAGAAGQLAVALGPAAGGVLSLGAALGAAIAPAAGLAVALPAVAVAWKTSMAIMTLAVEGFSDTLGAAVAGDADKFKKSLEELPPAARSVAGELSGAMFGLQKMVQQAFFAPIAAESKHLGRQLRVPLVMGASEAASAFGRLGARAVVVAREGRSIAFLQRVFATIAVTADRAGRGVAPLLRGLREIATVGLSRIPRVGTAIGGAAASMGRWLQQISASGRAARWFDRAVRVLAQLGRIAANVGRTIGAVFGAAADGAGNVLTPIERVTRRLSEWSQSAAGRAALLDFFYRGRQALNQLGRVAGNLGRALAGIFKQAGSGQADFLATLERLTAQFAAWVNSAKGQQQLGQTFAMLNQVTHDLMTILPGLAVVIGQVAGFITSLPAPVRGVVTNFLAWSLVIGLISGKIGPLILGAGKMALAIGSVSGALRNNQSGLRRFLSRMGSAFATVGRWARQAAVAVGRAAVSMAQAAARGAAAAARMAAAGARALATAAVAAGRAAAQFLLAAGRMALAAAQAAGRVVLAGLQMAASAALTAGRVVGAWVVMGTQALIQGAKAAMFWILANAPIVLLVAAAIAAVVLIIKYWDKIVAFFTEKLPRWLKKGLDLAVTLIKNAAKFGFFGPVGLIIAHWGKISKFFTQTLPKAVGDGAERVVGWLRRLPGWVVSSVGNMGKLLVNAGKSLLIGLWNGIVDRASWLQRSLVNLVKRIVPGPVARVLGIASPSKLFAGYGENLAQGLALGMDRASGLVADAAGALAGSAAGGASALARPGVRRPAGAVSGGGGVARVELAFANADQEFVRFFRKVVRTKGRGDVQVLVAGRSA